MATNKTALVTGAAGGLGRCLARRLARRYDNLLLLDHDKENLSSLAGELSRSEARIETLGVDITKREMLDNKLNPVVDKVGGLDLLLNNAGIARTGMPDELTISDWRCCFEVNTLAPIDLFYRFYDTLSQNNGHLVNVSTGLVNYRPPGWAPYIASKAALAVFSEQVHIDTAESGLSVTTVYPGIMRNTGFPIFEGMPTRIEKLFVRLFYDYISTTPNEVADDVVVAITNKKPRVYSGPGSLFVRFLGRMPKFRAFLWRKIVTPLVYTDGAVFSDKNVNRLSTTIRRYTPGLSEN